MDTQSLQKPSGHELGIGLQFYNPSAITTGYVKSLLGVTRYVRITRM